MRHLVAAVMCLVSVSVNGAEIVGPQQPARIEGVTKVKVGQPPWVKLDVLDAPEGAIITWRGPVGEGEVGSPCENGLKVSNSLVGTHTFEAVIQTVLPGADTIEFIKHVVVIESTVVVPPPDDPPDDDPPDDEPPDDDPPDDPLPTDLTSLAKTWLATVPAAKQGIKTEVAKTLREIGTSASLQGIDEMELFLGLGLTWSIGTETAAWASFSTSANKALDALKASGATAAQYKAALKSIAQGIDPQ